MEALVKFVQDEFVARKEFASMLGEGKLLQ